MDNDAALLDAALQFPQKRVLPSRSRRGGPGVGNCDVDVMILNAQVNKSENEPLIPADSRFVFKTNDALEQYAKEFAVASTSGFNLRATESYFDRPEVLKSYREQINIETPEYSNVKEEGGVVGSRLRSRPKDDDDPTDDAIYEKRHKKYEKFEKGQRLREKEKLKHAQYKLKERIEQLRGMDNSAFMAAPASSFSSRPSDSQEMLENAEALEERYRILLPPDRQRKPAGQFGATDGDSELSGKETVRATDNGESAPDEDHPKEKLKLKLPARASIAASPISTPKISSSASKKRRRTPPSSSTTPLHPPKASGSRKNRHPQVPAFNEGEPGPSNFDPLFNTVAQPQNAKRSRQPAPKKPKTESHSSSSRGNHYRDHTARYEDSSTAAGARLIGYSSQNPNYAEDDESMPMSDKHSSSGHQGYSYPPPPPRRDDYPSPQTTGPPVDIMSEGPGSPIDSDLGQNDLSNDFSARLQPPTPPAEPRFSVTPDDQLDRKGSLPPIESISAPASAAPRRVRVRVRAATARVSAPRKTPTRRPVPCQLVTVAQRALQNPRQLKHGRNHQAFGVKLPEIIHGNDSAYDFELPPEIHVKTNMADVTHDSEADDSREIDPEDLPETEEGTEPPEGSVGPKEESEVEEGTEPEGSVEPKADPELELEAMDVHEPQEVQNSDELSQDMDESDDPDGGGT
ncbi:PEHE domain-containing protein [Favolaschia claudopus]|uniref:PEHE domain-containing protein n=1 Tax=Favolaschia claudopus TaxID=2862362 RepID=A0AAW0EHG5_9AGAR